MLRTTTLLLGLMLLSRVVGQEPVLVRDSILNAYMQSGQANTLFQPKGRTDKKERRQGKWKDYKVMEDFVMTIRNGVPVMVGALYLVYGEGNYVDDKPEGPWTWYTIVDKTFKHLPYKKVTYVNGLEEGRVTYSYPSGATGFEGTYRDGKMHGPSKSLFADGSLHASRIHEKGLLSGQMTGYYPDGKVQLTVVFVNDTMEGPYTGYYPDGRIEEQYTYVKGVADGVYHYYHPNGQLWIERIYDKGRTMNVTGSYDANGTARDHGTLKDGNGTVKFYDGDGRLYSVVHFQDGTKVKEENPEDVAEPERWRDR